MRIDGNVTLIVCDTTEEKQMIQSAMATIFAKLIHEDSALPDFLERYIYYDLKTGHLFVVEHTKK